MDTFAFSSFFLYIFNRFTTSRYLFSNYINKLNIYVFDKLFHLHCLFNKAQNFSILYRTSFTRNSFLNRILNKPADTAKTSFRRHSQKVQLFNLLRHSQKVRSANLQTGNLNKSVLLLHILLSTSVNGPACVVDDPFSTHSITYKHIHF